MCEFWIWLVAAAAVAAVVVWRSWREIWEEELKREFIPCISLLQGCIVRREWFRS